MKKYKTISSLIKNLQLEVKLLQSDISTLKAKPSNFNEEIIVKYIETRSTVKTAVFVKAKGVKAVKGTVIAAGDISTLIKNGAKDISPKLLSIARKIFYKNKKVVDKIYN